MFGTIFLHAIMDKSAEGKLESIRKYNDAAGKKKPPEKREQLQKMPLFL